MATMDSSAINVSLPTIARQYNASMPAVEWVVISYLLAVAAFLLPFGRLGDQWGRRKLFMFGMVFFTASSMLCAMANSVSWLIIARVIQGIGGAIFISITPAILVDSFATSERGKAIGLMGTVVSTGLMLGAPIGGLLTHYLSWRWIFLVNIPVGILGYFLAAYNLPKDLQEKKKFVFDLPGAICIVSASSLFLFAVNKISIWGLLASKTLGLFGLSVFFFYQFLRIERKNPYGVLDLSLFKNRLFLGGTLSLFCHFLALFILYFLTPFYLTEVLHKPANEVGYVMMFFSVGFALVMPLSGRFSDRLGSKILSPVGLLITFFVYLWATYLNEASPIWHVIGILTLVGAGGGLFQAPNNSALFGAVSRAKLGTVSSLIATMRTFGIMMGVALATLIFSLRIKMRNGFEGELSAHEIPQDLFVIGFQETLFVSVGVALVAIFFSLIRFSSTWESSTLNRVLCRKL